MQNTAQSYLVYELTKSAAYLGYVGFAMGLPSWLFMLYGGVIADRVPRRTLLIITQTAMMIPAFILAGLVFAHAVKPWHIIAVAFFLGVAMSFDAPARQAFVVELVEPRDLTNAIALNSAMFTAAMVAGPAMAGIIYSAMGPLWCFLLNGLSFIAVIIALARMRILHQAPKPAAGSTFSHLKQGLSYTVTEPMVRALILNVGLIGLFGMSILTILPDWAVQVLNGDVKTNAWLLSSRGLGALAGALLMAAVSQRGGRGKIWTAGSLLMPLSMLLFAGTRITWLSLAFIMLMGFGFMISLNTTNALIQSTVPDGLRGRVMSIYTLTFFGGLPLGSLLVGHLAHAAGAPLTVFIAACFLLAASLVILLRLPFIRELD